MSIRKEHGKKLPIVEIEWLDSQSQGRWGSRAGYEKTCDVAECTTIGYLLSKDSRKVTVVQTRHPLQDDVLDAISIPTAAIKRIRRIPKKKR